MNTSDFQFKQLDPDGVRTLVNWAEAEGWNPGPHDADVFYATDPEGFYGFFRGDELVAGGSIVSYGGAFGFMGLFIVKPEYRSAGIGRDLWYRRRDMLRSRLAEGAPIGMDGVVAMQPFYEKGGFRIAFRDERYVTTGRLLPLHPSIAPLTAEDMPQVLEYDRYCFGCERPQFLRLWQQLAAPRTFKYVEDGVLKGFAMVRQLRSGYKIGPLFADNGQVAEELYKACLNSVDGDQIYIDIPVPNSEAGRLVKAYEATYVFECARMYHGNFPDVDINKVFGITTFELG